MLVHFSLQTIMTDLKFTWNTNQNIYKVIDTDQQVSEAVTGSVLKSWCS